MSSVIRQETVVFFCFVLHGAGMTFFYDILRALRRSLRHSLAVVSLEDFLFWMAAGFLTFYLAFLESDGAVRDYAAVGMLLGFLLYHFTLSPFFVKILAALFGGIIKVWRLLLRRISGAWRIATYPCRILKKRIQKNCKICKKRIEIAQKKDYNGKKMFRKG